jgi:hypothetical protein
MGFFRVKIMVWAALGLSACGTSVTSREKKTEATVSSPFFVASISPASGTVAQLPSTVTFFFNDFPNRGLAAAVTHYNLNCGGGAMAASSVDSVSGFSSVTATLPDPGTLNSGAECSVTISSRVTDQNGNPLSGERSVVYKIQ